MIGQAWRHCWDARNHLVARRFNKEEQVQGDHLNAPEKIEVDHVLAHALDHLAWLNGSDESIKAVSTLIVHSTHMEDSFSLDLSIMQSCKCRDEFVPTSF